MSEPTWPNHPQLFHAAGFRVRTYPYTDADAGGGSTRRRCSAALGGASPGDVVLLHGACHNPTGVDPSPDLWRRIGDVVEERRLLPLVDLAYQGFGDGLREDAAGLLELVRPGVELLVSTSFSKTFSLYAERVGAMLVIAASAADAAAVQSHVKAAIRTNYSNPPAHGADIVRTILADADLRPRWEAELAAMRDRIKANRRALVAALEARSIPGDWGGIATQRGMFALLGLSTHQVARLRDEHAVYVVGHGRINVAGFTSVEPRAVRRRARRGARLVLGAPLRPRVAPSSQRPAPRDRRASATRSPAAVDPRPDERGPGPGRGAGERVERVARIGRVGLAQQPPRRLDHLAVVRASSARPAAASPPRSRRPSRAPADQLLEPAQLGLELGRHHQLRARVVEREVDPAAHRAPDGHLRA